MPDDIVRDFLRRLRELHPEQPRDDLLRLEYELRRDWGGANYVRKVPATGKAWCLGVSLAAGTGPREAMAALGISRRHGYRLLRRRWCEW
jgi:hypothetical protein